MPGGSRPSPIPSLPRWINHSAGSANLEAMLGRDLAMPRGWKVGASAAVCGMEIWKGATARDGRELPHQLARTVSHGRALCVAKEGGGRDRGEKRDELDLTTTPLPTPPTATATHRSPTSALTPALNLILYSKVSFYATRDIAAGEMLLWDYARRRRTPNPGEAALPPNWHLRGA